MKLTHLLLSVAALIFAGCASSGSSSMDEGALPAEETSEVETGSQTGNTGSGLLMDRYKSGEIPGYRD